MASVDFKRSGCFRDLFTYAASSGTRHSLPPRGVDERETKTVAFACVLVPFPSTVFLLITVVDTCHGTLSGREHHPIDFMGILASVAFSY